MARNHWHPLRYIQSLSSVSVLVTLTPLMAFTRFDNYHTLLIALLNDDTTSSIDLLIETSEDGVAVDAERVTTLTVPAKVGAVVSQRSYEVADNVRGYYRVSATASAGTAAARWVMKGIPRLT